MYVTRKVSWNNTFLVYYVFWYFIFFPLLLVKTNCGSYPLSWHHALFVNCAPKLKNTLLVFLCGHLLVYNKLLLCDLKHWSLLFYLKISWVRNLVWVILISTCSLCGGIWLENDLMSPGGLCSESSALLGWIEDLVQMVLSIGVPAQIPSQGRLLGGPRLHKQNGGSITLYGLVSKVSLYHTPGKLFVKAVTEPTQI
jgi:hypothetical protein